MARVKWFLQKYESDLGLALISVLWGSTFPIIRTALQDVDPHTFVAIRFGIAAVAIAPLIFFSSKLRREFWSALPWGITLGVVMFTVFLSQTIGLKTVPSARGAFITGTSVLLVPLLSPFFKRGLPKRGDMLGALLALLGLFLLLTPESGGLTTGDLYIVISAVAIAVHMHLLQIACAKNKYSDMILVYWQTLAIAAFSTLSIPLTVGRYGSISVRAFAMMAFCAILVSLGTFWLQARYQKRTSPEHAAMVFSLEPVFATVFGFFILGEVLNTRGYTGAGVILFAIMGTSLVGRIFARSRLKAGAPGFSVPSEAQNKRSLP